MTALFAVAVAFFVLALIGVHSRTSSPPEAMLNALADRNISVGVYADYMTALQILFGLTNLVVAAVILRFGGQRRIVLMVSVMLILIGVANPPNLEGLAHLDDALLPVARVAQISLYAALVSLLLLFPDGRWASRWSSFFLGGWLALLVPAYLIEEGDLSSPGPLSGVTLLVGLLVGGLVQIYRLGWVSSRIERQQTKWVVSGIILALAIQFAVIMASSQLPSFAPDEFAGSEWDPISTTGITLAYAAIPLTLGASVLGYRLWDIDIVISRALVYVILTLGVVALYVLATMTAGFLFGPSSDPVAAVLVTAIAAVLFAPVKSRLQQAVNHLLFGLREEPHVLVSRLGRRLEQTLAPDALLSTLIETIKDALKLSYVGVALGPSSDAAPERATGNPEGEITIVPLMYQGQTMGSMHLGARGRGDRLTSRDLKLLTDLAPQAAVALRSVLLTTELQRARENLVSSREEERRRLRRDLHDGLGSQLAGQIMALGSMRQLITRNPEAALAVLNGLIEQTQAAVSDIRALIYDLRPSSLDDLGLVGALEQEAARYKGSTLSVELVLASDVEALPAAVEVAVYRIVQEALANVGKHARASSCTIAIAVQQPPHQLVIEVRDDGIGLPSDVTPGVGIASMRERAEEIGGRLEFVTLSARGTGIRVVLPLPEVGS